jgi:glycosyltransferase involved in cell wall biosynthesis
LLGTLPDEEVDRWLKTADIFVAPSIYESFGLGFLEAMRWGTPVIGTHAGGIPEVVRHEHTGLLVPPADPARLAEAIVRLARDPELRRELEERGRRSIESTFSSQAMANSVSKLYYLATSGG